MNILLFSAQKLAAQKKRNTLKSFENKVSLKKIKASKESTLISCNGFSYYIHTPYTNLKKANIYVNTFLLLNVICTICQN